MALCMAEEDRLSAIVEGLFAKSRRLGDSLPKGTEIELCH